MEAVRTEVAKQSGGKQEIWTQFSLPKDASAYLTSSRKRNVSTSKLPPSNPKPGDEWINSLGMVFCWCPPGKFRMGIDGSPTPQTRDASPVGVIISKGFWISKYEASLGDYSRARYGRTKPLRDPVACIGSTSATCPSYDNRPFRCFWVYENLDPRKRKQMLLPRAGVIACRPKRNGSTPAGLAALLATPLVIRRELARFANFADRSLPPEDGPTFTTAIHDQRRWHGQTSGANRFVPAQRLGNSRHARKRFRVRAPTVS